MSFHIASPKEILSGQTADIYFYRTQEILKKHGIPKRVKAEFMAGGLPYEWGVYSGLSEIQYLLKDLNVQMRGLTEGTFFRAGEPVLTIEGNYLEFGVYETAILGLMCQASGITTKAARLKKLAQGKPLFSFGVRRMHPALSPMIERNAYIGGCDGVSSIKSAELIGIEPTGTMPHALMLLVGSEEKAFKLFHQILSKKVKRIALVDTFSDEKFGALLAAKTLKKDLYGVRLDTPASRKGDMAKIIREVRWELTQAGYPDVKIFISGGLNEKSLADLSKEADGFGIGTAISNAEVINFSMDLVEIDGKPVSKRGKLSGEKRVLRCKRCYVSHIHPIKRKNPKCNSCRGEMDVLTEPISPKTSTPLSHIRESVLKQLNHYHV